MTTTQQPEALQIASLLEWAGMSPFEKRTVAELRRQHARIAELEARERKDFALFAELSPSERASAIGDLMALADTYAGTAATNGIRSPWAAMARMAIEREFLEKLGVLQP